MVKPAATWFVIATLALVTTSAQPVGDYSASTSTLKMRASVSDGSLIWEFERRAGPKVSITIEFPLEGDSDKYTVDYPDFGLFESLFTSAFPEVQMQDGDLTDLAQYSLISFKTALAGEELIFFREALPLRAGIYVYDQGDSFRLTLRITPASVFMTFRCPDASRGKRFSDLTVGGATNIQFLPGGDADYASFIRGVAENCPGSDLPTGGTPSFFVFSATPNRVYLQLEGLRTKTLALDRIE